jgi:hypothetical protein
MRRRQFLGFVGGASIAWPLTGHAQKTTLPVVGFLNSASADGYASMRIAVWTGDPRDTRPDSDVRVEFCCDAQPTCCCTNRLLKNAVLRPNFRMFAMVTKGQRGDQRRRRRRIDYLFAMAFLSPALRWATAASAAL